MENMSVRMAWCTLMNIKLQNKSEESILVIKRRENGLYMNVCIKLHIIETPSGKVETSAFRKIVDFSRQIPLTGWL